MNKRFLTLACGTAAVLLVSFVAPRQAEQGSTDAKKVDPQKQVAELEKRTAGLERDLAETRALLEATVRYLESQQAAALALADVLDEAEAKGFTYGINPDSRTALLRGWRDQISSAQQGLPELPAAGAPKSEKPAPPKPNGSG